MIKLVKSCGIDRLDVLLESRDSLSDVFGILFSLHQVVRFVNEGYCFFFGPASHQSMIRDAVCPHDIPPQLLLLLAGALQPVLTGYDQLNSCICVQGTPDLQYRMTYQFQH